MIVVVGQRHVFGAAVSVLSISSSVSKLCFHKERERERERDREIERERETVCVCVCVCEKESVRDTDNLGNI